MNKFQYVIFDLMGVLYKNGHIIKQGLSEFLDQDYLKVKEKYNQYKSGKIEFAEFWQTLKQDKKVEKQFLRSLAIDPSAVEVVENLKKNYQVGSITNLPVSWARFLARLFKFDKIIISAEHDCLKPQSEIYHILLKKTGVKPARCLFIDDNLINLEVPAKMGMTTVWFSREKQDLDFKPDFTISELKELYKIIK